MDTDVVEPDPYEVSLAAERSYLIWSAYLENARSQAGITEFCPFGGHADFFSAPALTAYSLVKP
jgi:hypothetical protein